MTEDDMATAREEQDRELALKVRKAAGPEATGACLCCGEPVAEGRRWCDADCRDDWQREEARKAR